MQQQQYCCRQGVWQTSTVEYESQQSCSDKCNVPLERLQLHYALTDEATTHLKPYLLYVSVVFVQRLRKTLVDLYPSTTLSFKSLLFTLESLSSIKAVAWILKGSSLPVHSNTVFTPNYRVSHLNYCLMLMIWETSWLPLCENLVTTLPMKCFEAIHAPTEIDHFYIFWKHYKLPSKPIPYMSLCVWRTNSDNDAVSKMSMFQRSRVIALACPVW